MRVQGSSGAARARRWQRDDDGSAMMINWAQAGSHPLPSPTPPLPPQDHLHAAKNLVESFKEPVCLVPVELPQIDGLKPFASWLGDHAGSLEQLRYKGLRIGSLPPFIGPVFTFTNASSCRCKMSQMFTAPMRHLNITILHST